MKEWLIPPSPQKILINFKGRSKDIESVSNYSEDEVLAFNQMMISSIVLSPRATCMT